MTSTYTFAARYMSIGMLLTSVAEAKTVTLNLLPTTSGGGGTEPLTYDDFSGFCASYGMRMCTYNELCPDGDETATSGTAVASAPALSGEIAPIINQDLWVPYANEQSFVSNDNLWVQLGNRGVSTSGLQTCLTHVAVAGSPPSWGLDASFASFLHYTLCCDECKDPPRLVCLPPATNRLLLSDESFPVEERGHLRAATTGQRELNGWFPCGSTHCVDNRATCVEDAAEPYCQCNAGYIGKECRQQDECKTSFPCPGGSKCVDMDPPMRFKCACESGYEAILSDATTFEEEVVPIEYRPLSCLDKNECSAADSPCHANATCTNTIGSFECKCNDGWLGNGITSCEEPKAAVVGATADLPPGTCTTFEDCKGSNMQCDESKCVCIPGYARVGPNCQNEVHCDAGGHNNNCHERATCTELSGYPGFSCNCTDGWEDEYEGANGEKCKRIPAPATDPPPEPITEAVTEAAGVGPHPNRPTVFPPCLANDAFCDTGGTCCSGICDF